MSCPTHIRERRKEALQALGTHTGVLSHTGVLVILLALTLIVAEGTGTAKSGAHGEQSRQNEKSTLDFVQSLLDMEDRGRVQPVEGSRLVHEIDSAKLVLVERHSDGGTLIPGRSTGVFDVQPYVTVTTRRGTAADPLGMRVEWKVGNCLVGPDLAFTVVLLDDEPIGSCWSPHCYVNLSSPARGGGGATFAVLLLRTGSGEPEAGAEASWTVTAFGRSISLVWLEGGDARETHRQQPCLPHPAASQHGDLYVSDVVYSRVHRQLILFGPTRKPLGGLYCEWDGNPQTSTTARKVCHGNRVADELQRAWLWPRPPDGSWVLNKKGSPYKPRRRALKPAADASTAAGQPGVAAEARAGGAGEAGGSAGGGGVEEEERQVAYQCVFPATSARGEVVSAVLRLY